jgi:protein tyrosine phosphatase
MINYWHFEIWIKNNTGSIIPRDKSNARIKYLAKSILEYIVAEAIILKSSVNSFKRFDFDSKS